MPFWLPQGTVLLRLIEAEVRKQLDARGYLEIKTPQVLDVELWHRSGHWDNYKENMFFTAPSEREGAGEEREYALKPMNCPGACLVFASGGTPTASCRCASLSSGSSRATSARASSTACSACAPSPRTTHTSTARSTRSTDEVDSICSAIDELYERFGFDEVRVELSTRPEKSIGTDEQWERAEDALREALERQGREYDVEPGRGHLLRPQDRLPHHGCPGPVLAVRHLPARLPDAGALRALTTRAPTTPSIAR